MLSQLAIRVTAGAEAIVGVHRRSRQRGGRRLGGNHTSVSLHRMVWRLLILAHPGHVDLGGGRKGYSRLRRWEAVGSISLELPPNVRKSYVSRKVPSLLPPRYQPRILRKAFQFRLNLRTPGWEGRALHSSQ